MKQILYFLLGILISFYFVTAVYATGDITPFTLCFAERMADTFGYPNYTNLGIFNSLSELRAATPGAVGEKTAVLNGVPGTSGAELCDQFPELVGATIVWRTDHNNDQFGFYSSFHVPTVTDSDGDGIPDDEDMYPNDPTPFNVKLISYQTADGTANGQHVRECYQTDRGDIYCIGADFDENKTNYLAYTSPWIPYESANTDTQTDGVISNSNEGSTIEQPDFTTDAPTGDAPASNDPGFEDGTPSTGSETDNEALRGIMDNTSKIASNTSRQGDYMKELTRAIQNMDRNIALSSQGNTQDELEKAQDEAEAQAAQSNFDNLSVSDYYSGVSGEITEGEDYDAPGELTDESFFTSFFNSNPLITAFNNSGFESTSSSSSMTLTLPGLGIHQLDLIDLQPGLAAFGNLLFAFCSLGSLIMMVRG